MKMISVTLSNTGALAMINIDKIHIFYATNNGTRIWLGARDDDYFDVKEDEDYVYESITELSD